MFVLATAALDIESGDLLGTSAHLDEAEMHAYLRSAYDPEHHLAETPNTDLIEGLADVVGVRVLVETRHAPAFHQSPDPVEVLVTDDGELKCPACGHTGSMIRVVAEVSTEKVWLVTHGRTRTDVEGQSVTVESRSLDAKGLDTESGESAYNCYECDTPLDMGDLA